MTGSVRGVLTVCNERKFNILACAFDGGRGVKIHQVSAKNLIYFINNATYLLVDG